MDQGPNRVFDEFAKLMTDAAGVAQGVKREAETAVRSQAERFLNQMDLVQREDFDAVREMASRARSENDSLKQHLSELELRIVALEAGKKPAKKPVSKKK